jgi:hypothetical protein
MKYEDFSSMNHTRYSDFTLPGVGKNYAPDLKLEPIHTTVHLTVDLKAKSAAGKAVITIRANVEGAHGFGCCRF